MTLILIGLSSALVCSGIIMALLPLMRRYAMARPNARSSHTTPTPQGGGIAVVAAVMAVHAMCLIVEPLAGKILPPWQLPVSVLMMGVVGAWDDISPLSVTSRLPAQTLIIALLALSLPLVGGPLDGLAPKLQYLLLIVSALWFVNLVNFMDGLDWLTVSAMVPLTAAVAFFSAQTMAPVEVGVVAAALCGSLMGFGYFNRPIAKLFLGDVGSLPIGLLVAWMLYFIARDTALASAILLPLYHCMDATITLLLRLRRGEKIWQAHRTHFYQRAKQMGRTPIEIAATIFLLNIILAGLALLAAKNPSAWNQAVMLALGLCCVSFVLRRFMTPIVVRQ